MQKGAHTYLQTNISTNTPGGVLLMLYSGAITFLNQAKTLIDEKDYGGKGKAISRAMDVLNELSATLNKELGGTLAANLNSLYMWCITRLAMANLKLDKSIIDEVIGILSKLRDAYAQIQDLPEVQAVSTQIMEKQQADGRTPAALRTGNTAQTASAAAGQPLSGNSMGLAARGRNMYSKLSQVQR